MHSLVPLALAASLTLTTALPLYPRQLTGSTTANDVKNGVCAPVTLVYARGTTEAGNIGSTVGPLLASGLKAKLGNVAIQGVDYPASIGGNAQLGGAGGPAAAAVAQQALQQCPSTKIILGGYSQGAMVATNAVTASGLAAGSVTGAVLFGNPFQNRAGGSIPGVAAGKTLSQCAPGDGVCETGTFSVSAAHLSYTSNGDVDKAVDFVVSLVGGGGADAGTGTGTGQGQVGAGQGQGQVGAGQGQAGAGQGQAGTGQTGAGTGAGGRLSGLAGFLSLLGQLRGGNAGGAGTAQGLGGASALAALFGGKSAAS